MPSGGGKEGKTCTGGRLEASFLSLFALRHGEAACGALGHTRRDTPLSPEGVARLRALATRSEFPFAREPLPLIVSSSFRRALESAAILHELLGWPATSDARFDEFDFGWEDETLADFFTRISTERFRAFSAAPLCVALPGAESFADFFARVNAAFRDLLPRAEHGPVLIVAHDGVNRALSLIADGKGADAWGEAPPWQPGELRPLG